MTGPEEPLEIDEWEGGFEEVPPVLLPDVVGEVGPPRLDDLRERVNDAPIVAVGK